MDDAILLEFPNEITTDRLHLRVVSPGDGAMVYEALTASLGELAKWMTWVDKQTPESCEATCRRCYARWVLREDFNWVVLDRASGAFLGRIGAHNPDWRTRKLEIGYWLRDSAVGRGYMTEAVGALTDFLRTHLRLRRIMITCDADNCRSYDVAFPGRTCLPAPRSVGCV